MCSGLNSHYFHIIGDGHQPNNRVLYTNIATFDHFLYKDLVHHPIETTIYKWLALGFQGSCLFHISLWLFVWPIYNDQTAGDVNIDGALGSWNPAVNKTHVVRFNQYSAHRYHSNIYIYRCIYIYTPSLGPWTNIAPKNWCLEDEFPFVKPYFQVRAVSFREGIYGAPWFTWLASGHPRVKKVKQHLSDGSTVNCNMQRGELMTPLEIFPTDGGFLDLEGLPKFTISRYKRRTDWSLGEEFE